MKYRNNGKQILLVASGMSPQVLTETLFALVHQEKPFIPDEIHLVTTAVGRDKAVGALLNEGTGYFYRFCRDYGFSSGAFQADHIHTISDSQGCELSDIKTPKDNEAAADTITALIASLTSDPDATLHVSLAGGRKTMSYYTGYALSLYGRRQDQLSHVLISDGYEGCPEFYYPTPASQMITSHRGEPLDAALAQVTLAHIPFVRLREDLPTRFLEGTTGFSETVKRMGKVDEPKHLVLDIPNRAIKLSGIRFDLAERELEFAFLLMFVRNLLESGEEAGFEVPRKGPGQFAISKYFLTALCEIKGVSYTADWSELKNRLNDAEVQDRTLNSLENKDGSSSAMKDSFYSQRRNALLTLFRKELGKALAGCYLPQAKDDRGGYHALNLEAGQITLLS
ncbi:CRISPR-associated ring nuclease Csm6 [Endozoicomonas sp.]|uniref:CRISPR-associated ring nuclease Csm6 n=1 Tax=Endozoicomonas sp. TaxID=1892382 RepID=UPI0028836559|nr:CRISPR-associated ring nuclease Csm6 [Endozoicomonas sp.]